MPSYNFADHYKAAGLAPGPEIIALRQAPFEKLRVAADIALILNLTRLYFGLPTPGGNGWFREAFSETDISFSLLENEREVAVLSACLLAAILADGHICAALAPLVASAGGRRDPVLCPEFLETARQALVNHSVSSRKIQALNVSNIKLPVKNKVSATLDALVANPEWQKFADAIKATGNESFEATKALATQTLSVLPVLVEQVQNLREEVSMLWWYVGGWSRVLDKPFAELDVGVAALMAGTDMAHLVQGDSGPAAAQAILYRLINVSRPDMSGELSLEAAVDALPEGTYLRLEIPESIARVSDLCPVLCALMKSDEIGRGDTWHGAFRKASGLDATTRFTPLELAMQIYREFLLVEQVT